MAGRAAVAVAAFRSRVAPLRSAPSDPPHGTQWPSSSPSSAALRSLRVGSSSAAVRRASRRLRGRAAPGALSRSGRSAQRRDGARVSVVLTCAGRARPPLSFGSRAPAPLRCASPRSALRCAAGCPHAPRCARALLEKTTQQRSGKSKGNGKSKDGAAHPASLHRARIVKAASRRSRGGAQYAPTLTTRKSAGYSGMAAQRQKQMQPQKQRQKQRQKVQRGEAAPQPLL